MKDLSAIESIFISMQVDSRYFRSCKMYQKAFTDTFMYFIANSVFGTDINNGLSKKICYRSIPITEKYRLPNSKNLQFLNNLL